MIQVQRDEYRTRWAMIACFSVGSLLLLSQLEHGLKGHQQPESFAPSGTTLVRSNQLFLQTFGAQVVRTAFPQQTIRLVVDLSDRLVYVYKNDAVLVSYPIAIGQDGWETPQGTFSVMHMQENPVWRHPITGEWIPPGENSPLGTRWIGFWSDGLHQIGFHGTNQTDLIGQAVSHGCIRMYNSDIQDLYQYVALGTPVSIEP